MKEMDCVEIIVEKEKYAQDGVHKGMHGWICDERTINGTWLVNFPQYADKVDIATIAVKEEDMKIIPVMDAGVNEKIAERFGETTCSVSPSDFIVVLVEKEKYAKNDIHQGMRGKIIGESSVNNAWLVHFPMGNTIEDIEAFIDECDMECRLHIDTWENIEIYTRFKNLNSNA